MVHSMINFFKKPITIAITIIALIIITFVYFFAGDDSPSYEFIIAEKDDLVQEVSVTGRVKPAISVDLAFEKTGKILWINVNVGSVVSAGQAIVGIHDNDIAAELRRSEAQLKQQKVKLDELLGGTRVEELDIQEVKVQNGKVSLEEAEMNFRNILNDSYTKSDDAVRGKIDQFFINPLGYSPQVGFLVVNTQLEIDIESKRLLVESLLTEWKDNLDALHSESNFDMYAKRAEKVLDTIKLFLDTAALVVNNLEPNVNLSQPVIDSYKMAVSTSRVSVNVAISNLSIAEEKLKNARFVLAVREQEFTLQNAGTTEEQINAQKARIEEAEANISRYKVELSKTVLRSPIDGIITRQDAKIGEIVLSNATVVFVMSISKFEIEANVPEIDIAKLEIGDPAEVTLDAYGDSVIFNCIVVAINPRETIIDGVSTYKTTLQFVQKDERIRSGMTANIEIFTDSRENVISIPRRAVIIENRERIVRILVDEEIIEAKVRTGLASSDGRIEIREGIEEGDKVILFIDK